MEKEILFNNLSIWIKTFDCAKDDDDLTDGVIVAKVLNNLASDYFNDAWLLHIKTDESLNWRLKVSNLKKVLKCLLDYYAEVLGQQIADFDMPDINAIGERADRGELGRLLQLVLGCAVNCENKQRHIEAIMSLEETVQHAVMEAIQELMSKSRADSVSDLEDRLKKTIDEYHSAMLSRDEMQQRCHELDMQVSLLLEEKAALEAENAQLLRRAGSNSGGDGAQVDNSAAQQRIRLLTDQVARLQQEAFLQEADREEARARVDSLEAETAELRLRNEELTRSSIELRLLKDELDVLKEKESQMQKTETALEQYKKKFDEVGDLRRQIKILEETNTTYLQNNLQLEEEVKKCAGQRSQMDVFKRQISELQARCSEETQRADKCQFEVQRATERLEMMTQERQRLAMECATLNEKIEELQMSRYNDVTRDSGSNLGGVSSFDAANMLGFPPDARAQIIRLQHENRLLRENAATNASSSTDINGMNGMDVLSLQASLEASRTRVTELEAENRAWHQQIMQLEAQLEDARSGSGLPTQPLPDGALLTELRRQVSEQLAARHKLEMELSALRNRSQDNEERLRAAHTRCSELSDCLNRKDSEMRSMEERYRRYLEKAKNVIRQMARPENGASDNSAVELGSLRQQIAEKDCIIKQIESQQEHNNELREDEEKMVVAAWYNLGLQLNRQAAEDRLGGSTSSAGAGSSFLARQRSAHLRRPANGAISGSLGTNVITGQHR